MEPVALAHAVSDPGAVMIMGGHAMVASFAVLAAQRLFDVADRAVFVFDKQHHIVLIVLLVFFGQAVVELYDDIGDFLDAVVESAWLVHFGPVLLLEIERRLVNMLALLLDDV